MSFFIVQGAIFENLTQVPLDAMPGMIDAVVRRKDPRSTIIGTISLWNNAISHELEKPPDSQITCVEMATFRGQSGGGEISSESKVLRRQGIVSLGRALRQLLLHASVGSEPVISWRESTLTHVLQRRLECSKVVVLGCVSQLSKDYEITLGTLNYLRRLLVKPGEVVSSPFRNSDAVHEHQTPDESGHTGGGGAPSNRLSEYARSPQLLEQIVTDPRQRLARLFKRSSPAQGFPEINYAPSKDDYQPIDYMDYVDENSVNNETNRTFIEERSIGENKSNVINSAHKIGELYGLRGRLPSSPEIMEHKNDSFNTFSVEEISQDSSGANSF
mmetsp:Transcript_27722/g.67468  ORF Transcript_27722/g.67468 Transcript_27722/m.67468 type:complete len:330 (-) Transcript_27722:77-1066(-)